MDGGRAAAEAQASELTEAFLSLLKDEKARAALGKAAQSVLDDSRGATRITVDRIAAIYKKASRRKEEFAG